MQKNHKGSDKWLYVLIALVIVGFYGLLGKADMSTAQMEVNAKQCEQHITAEAYHDCVVRLNK